MSELIVLIGESPNPNGDRSAPLEGAIGRRLAEYAGLTVDQYLHLTERHNLLPDDNWTAVRARAAASLVWSSLLGRRTILLGRRVASAFNVRTWDCRWVALDEQGTWIATLPHPSGLNTWWNDAEHRALARRFLRSTFGSDMT